MIDWTDNDDEVEQALGLENGVNRLARDLFLLTAVSALFLLMVSSSRLELAARQSWREEATARPSDSVQAPVVVVHLRDDGRLALGREVVDTVEQLAARLDHLLEQRPELKQARVLVNAYKDTPSLRTADVVAMLDHRGYRPEGILIRFCES